MAEAPPISRLGLHSFSTRVLGHVLGLGTSVLIARALGPEGRGRYVLPVTIATVVAAVINLGTPQAQFRLWSRRRWTIDEFVTSSVVLSVVLSVLGLTGLWLFYGATRAGLIHGVTALNLAIASCMVPFAINQSRSGNLLTFNHALRDVNRARLIGAAVQTSGIAVAFLWFGVTVEMVLVFAVLSVAVPSLLMSARLRNFGRLRGPIPWPLIREHLKVGLTIGPTSMFLLLNMRVDVFLVARYKGLAGVGIYSIGVAFAELLWLATEALSSSISGRQANDPAIEVLSLTYRAARMNLVLAVTLGVGIALVAPVAIPLVYGARFADATEIVWILVPAAALMGVWRPLNQAMVRFNRPGATSGIMLASLLVNVGANVLLIPLLGLVGAAVASLISYSFGALVSHVVHHRTHSTPFSWLIPRRQEIKDLVALARVMHRAPVEP